MQSPKQISHIAIWLKKQSINRQTEKAIKWQGWRGICDQAQVGMKHG